MKKIFLTLVIFLAFIVTSSFSQEKAQFDASLPDKISALFDWTFENPKDSAIATNFISNFIKAYDEFNPMGQYKIAVVSHGAEVLIFSKNNYEKYKDIVDRLKSMVNSYGVKIYVCRNTIRFFGLKDEDIQPFVTIVPAGVVEVAKLQQEGYKLIPAVVHDLNKVKTEKR